MSRIYVEPAYNLLMSVWLGGTPPDGNPPAAVDIPCQVYINPRYFIDIHEADTGYYTPPIIIRVPKGQITLRRTDIVLVSGSPRDYYKIHWGQWMHKGFPNQYIIYQAGQTDKFGSSFRTAGQTDDFS